MRKVARIGFYAAAVILMLSVSGCSWRINTLINRFDREVTRLERLAEQTNVDAMSEDDAITTMAEVMEIRENLENIVMELANYESVMNAQQTARVLAISVRMNKLF